MDLASVAVHLQALIPKSKDIYLRNRYARINGESDLNFVVRYLKMSLANAYLGGYYWEIGITKDIISLPIVSDQLKEWTDENKNNILHYAFAGQGVEKIKILVEVFGELMDQTNTFGFTPLEAFAISCNTKRWRGAFEYIQSLNGLQKLKNRTLNSIYEGNSSCYVSMTSGWKGAISIPWALASFYKFRKLDAYTTDDYSAVKAFLFKKSPARKLFITHQHQKMVALKLYIQIIIALNKKVDPESLTDAARQRLDPLKNRLTEDQYETVVALHNYGATATLELLDLIAQPTLVCSAFAEIILAMTLAFPKEALAKINFGERILCFRLLLVNTWKNVPIPYWVKELIATFSALGKNNIKDWVGYRGSITTEPILKFEELPEDLMLYLMTFLHVNQLIAFSLSNKRMNAMINEMPNAYIWRSLSTKYFPSSKPQTTRKSFAEKYKMKFRVPNRMNFIDVPRLGRWASLSGNFLLNLEHNFLTLRDLSLPRDKMCKLTIHECANTIFAGVYNEKIYCLTRSSVKIITLAGNPTHSVPVDKSQHTTFFTIDSAKLYTPDYEMDLETNKIVPLEYGRRLRRCIISDSVIYGQAEEELSTIFLTDKRFPGREIGRFSTISSGPNTRIFNYDMIDHYIYTVSSYVELWDRRNLVTPVKISNDLYNHESHSTHRPAFDFQSMTLIGSAQIWDLTDFKWQHPLIRNASVILPNGQKMVYIGHGTLGCRDASIQGDNLVSDFVVY